MIKAVICDLDDTLVDSSELHKAAFERVLNEEGHSLSDLPDSAWFACFGKRIRDIIDILYGHFPSMKRTREEFMRRREEIFLDSVSKALQPMPGFDALMAFLRSGDRICAVASSGTRAYVSLALQRLGVQKDFPIVVTGEDVQKGKPEPDVFLKTAELLGVSPRDCVVLEDAPHGIAAAKAAGMTCIAIRNFRFPTALDLSGADHVVNNLAEISDFHLKS